VHFRRAVRGRQGGPYQIKINLDRHPPDANPGSRAQATLQARTRPWWTAANANARTILKRCDRASFVVDYSAMSEATVDLDVDQFTLEKAVVEVRYPAAYAIWDRAGSVWSEVGRKWPDLKVSHAQPNKTAFTLDGGKFDAAVELEQSRVVAARPERSLDGLAEVASVLLEIVFRKLEVLTLDRVALRVLYFKKFGDAGQASAALLATDLVRVPRTVMEHRHEDKILLPEFASRIEGKNLGVCFRLRAESRTMDFEPPPEFEEIKPHHDETHGVVVDVDHYTKASIPIGKLNVREWISSSLKVARRDANRLLKDGTRA
jgi:hypothetical protein